MALVLSIIVVFVFIGGTDWCKLSQKAFYELWLLWLTCLGY